MRLAITKLAKRIFFACDLLIARSNGIYVAVNKGVSRFI